MSRNDSVAQKKRGAEKGVEERALKIWRRGWQGEERKELRFGRYFPESLGR